MITPKFASTSDEKAFKDMEGHMYLYERIFHHNDFDDSSKTKEILGNMPKYEEYLEAKLRLQKTPDKSQVQDYKNKLCNVEPILNKEQEYHVFRKFNFLKYLSNLEYRKGQFVKAHKLIMLAIRERNFLINCNNRLCVRYVNKFAEKLWNKNNLSLSQDDLYSEGYLLIVKSVEYFDWTRGTKFSTYVVNVLNNCLYRNCFRSIKNEERIVQVVDDKYSMFSMIPSKDDYHQQMKKVEAIKAHIEHYMERCTPRQRDILIKRFVDESTLAEVGVMFDVSKERIRQIQNVAIEKMREAMEEDGFNFESFNLN